MQRYERELGLPIRRPAGKPKGSVIATTAELDAWVSTAPIRGEFELTRAAVDNTSLLNEFRLNVKRLYQLGQKTEELRKDLASSLKLLRQNIHASAVQKDQFMHFPSKSAADTLMFDPKKQPN